MLFHQGEEREIPLERLLDGKPCVVCELMSGKIPDYRQEDPSLVWSILPIVDTAFRRMTGRSQKSIYAMCSKHAKAITDMIYEYVDKKSSEMLVKAR